MPDTRSNFMKYLDKWRQIFPEARKLQWRDSSIENDYCRDCRFCCGPQGDDEPFPMALMPWQLSPANKDDFFMLNEDTALLGADGCKSITPEGCRLPRKKRPIACGLFPIVLANGRLYLYKCCPAAIMAPLAQWAMLARNVEDMLLGMDIADLRHLSLNISPRTLSEKYVDMDIKIF